MVPLGLLYFKSAVLDNLINIFVPTTKWFCQQRVCELKTHAEGANTYHQQPQVDQCSGA